MDNVVADARDINPNLEVMEISSIKDQGIDEWCNWLLEKVAEKQQAANTVATAE